MASGSQVCVEATHRAGEGESVCPPLSDGRFIRQLSQILLVTLTFVACVGLVHVSGPAVASADPAEGTTDPLTAAELVQLKTTAVNGVVRVSATVCGSSVIGTGYLSSQGVVTNHHLVAGHGPVWLQAVTDRGREDSVDSSVLSASRPLDLAIVQLGAEQAATLQLEPLESASPISGERVLLAGYGGGGSALYFLETTVHLVVPGQAYGIDGEVVLIDRTIVPGFSGGPVLNRRGEVVAVLKGMDKTTGLAVAISSVMLGDASQMIDIKVDDAACK